MTRVPTNAKKEIKEPEKLASINQKEPNAFRFFIPYPCLGFGVALCFTPLFPVGLALLGLGAAIMVSNVIYACRREQKQKLYSQYKDWEKYEDFLGVSYVSKEKHQEDLKQQKINDVTLVNVMNDLVKELEKEAHFTSKNPLVTLMLDLNQIFRQQILSELKKEYAFGYGILIKEEVHLKLKNAFDIARKGGNQMNEDVISDALEIFKEKMSDLRNNANATRQGNYANIPGLVDPCKGNSINHRHVGQSKPREGTSISRMFGF